MNIQGVYHVNINCSNLEKSKAFYEMLGFEAQYPLTSYADPVGSSEIAAALGLPADAKAEGYMMQLGHNNSCRVDLLCWEQIPGVTPEKPSNHMTNLGMQRLNLWTKTEDFDADIEEIKKFGVEVFGVPMDGTMFGMPCKIFLFLDPDGTVIELTNVDPSYAT